MSSSKNNKENEKQGGKPKPTRPSRQSPNGDDVEVEGNFKESGQSGPLDWRTQRRSDVAKGDANTDIVDMDIDFELEDIEFKFELADHMSYTKRPEKRSINSVADLDQFLPLPPIKRKPLSAVQSENDPNTHKLLPKIDFNPKLWANPDNLSAADIEAAVAAISRHNLTYSLLETPLEMVVSLEEDENGINAKCVWNHKTTPSMNPLCVCPLLENIDVNVENTASINGARSANNNNSFGNNWGQLSLELVPELSDDVVALTVECDLPQESNLRNSSNDSKLNSLPACIIEDLELSSDESIDVESNACGVKVIRPRRPSNPSDQQTKSDGNQMKSTKGIEDRIEEMTGLPQWYTGLAEFSDIVQYNGDHVNEFIQQQEEDFNEANYQHLRYLEERLVFIERRLEEPISSEMALRLQQEVAIIHAKLIEACNSAN